MEKDDALRKIRACMNLANDNAASEGEVDNALRMADKLMKKFGIDMAEMMQEGKRLEFEFVTEFCAFGDNKSNPLWFQWMAVAVAKFTDCIAKQKMHYPNIGIDFQGHKEDAIFAAWLLDHIKNQLRLATRRANCGSPSGRETFRKAFAKGVCAKLNEARANRPLDMPKNALVVVDQKLAERDAHFGGERYRESKSRARFDDFENYHKGFTAGKAVSVNKPIEN